MPIRIFFGYSKTMYFPGTPAERLTLYRAVRSVDLAKRFYSFPAPGKEDVVFDLVDLMRVNIGDPFTVTVNIENKSNEVRTIKAILSAGSVYYTGIKANIVKRASGSFALQPHSRESKTIFLHPFPFHFIASKKLILKILRN